jgi:hypothetical protein
MRKNSRVVEGPCEKQKGELGLPGLVAQICNSSTVEVKAGES